MEVSSRFETRLSLLQFVEVNEEKKQSWHVEAQRKNVSPKTHPNAVKLINQLL